MHIYSIAYVTYLLETGNIVIGENTNAFKLDTRVFTSASLRSAVGDVCEGGEAVIINMVTIWLPKREGWRDLCHLEAIAFKASSWFTPEEFSMFYQHQM